MKKLEILFQTSVESPDITQKIENVVQFKSTEVIQLAFNL